MKEKQWQEAASRWALIRNLYPNIQPAWVQGGLALSKCHENQAAEDLLLVAVNKFPENANALVVLIDFYIGTEGFSQAEQFLNVFTEKFPDLLYGHARSVDLLIKQGQFEEAESANQVTKSQFEEEPWPYIQHAEIAMAREEWREALVRWADVRRRFPDHWSGYGRASEASESLGDTFQAQALKDGRRYGADCLDQQLAEVEGHKDSEVKPLVNRNFFHMVELVWTKARLNLKSEASKNYLRHVWWVLDPLLYMAVFYVVFGLLLERGGEDFVVYLLTGLVPFQWFAKTTQLASGSILGGRGLMNQVRIPPIFFPMVVVVQTAGKQLMIYAMLLVFLLFYGISPAVQWFALIPVILIQLVLVVAVACTVSMVIPFFRDLSNLVPTGIQFVMFSSGIFYSVDRLSEQWQTLFYLNPVATLIKQYRLILMDGQLPQWVNLGWVLLGSTITLVVIIILYRQLAPIYPRVVIE